MASEELTQARSEMNEQLDALKRSKKSGDHQEFRRQMEASKNSAKRFFQAFGNDFSKRTKSE